ncbi:hypothetical protein ACHQM5_026094 [Ranunculus cassubicifolius]
MTGSSDEFAAHLFDTLARRRGLMSSAVTKDQLKDLYELLADKGFDSRLQTFFDMVDKNGDGRISEEEVKEIIDLSASTNKLLKIHNRLDEYTALIMDALDPDHFGYIEIDSLKALLIKEGWS